MPKGLMLTDLAIAGLLLILAKVIRVHTPLLQRMYIPSAVLAGLFGLIFGPALLNILPWTDTFTANASLLTAALFSALGLATDVPSPKTVAQRARLIVGIQPNRFCFTVVICSNVWSRDHYLLLVERLIQPLA
ncbi:hypothetical protein OGZ01_07970 [Vibrio harveyi]|nr:hypothetical protein [Vibrio harveyi]